MFIYIESTTQVKKNKCKAKDFTLYRKGEGRSETKIKMKQKYVSDWSWKVISIVLVPPLDHTSAVDLEMTGGTKDSILLC